MPQVKATARTKVSIISDTKGSSGVLSARTRVIGLLPNNAVSWEVDQAQHPGAAIPTDCETATGARRQLICINSQIQVPRVA